MLYFCVIFCVSFIKLLYHLSETFFLYHFCFYHHSCYRFEIIIILVVFSLYYYFCYLFLLLLFVIMPPSGIFPETDTVIPPSQTKTLPTTYKATPRSTLYAPQLLVLSTEQQSNRKNDCTVSAKLGARRVTLHITLKVSLMEVSDSISVTVCSTCRETSWKDKRVKMQ